MTLPTVSIVLPDGSNADLRPVEADDKSLLEAAFDRLSSQSRRMRFLSSVDRLSRAQLAYLTELDQLDHVAVGVLIGKEAVAVGRMVRLAGRPEAAEVAITVLDAYQRRGIGTRLLEALSLLANNLGIEQLQFEVLGENEPMLRLLRRVGAELILSDGLVKGLLAPGTVDLDYIPGPQLLDLLSDARRRRGEDQRGSSFKAAELMQ
jgi:ribosomal protein S18 acetylase RimI-like enzyme